MQLILLYVGGALTCLWGIAHIFPTKSVVKGFGDISIDNKRIITMEWIVEAVALIFLGLLISMVAFLDPFGALSKAIYALSITALVALALVSLFTGFKIKFVPFRLCPVIFMTSAIFVYFGGIA